MFNTDAENTGAELELILNPTQGLEFLFGVSFQDAQQQDVAFGPITKDRAMPNAPNFTFNGLARYEWQLGNGSVAIQADVSYVDKRALNGIDHPGLIADSYTIANARIGFITDDEAWDFSVWIKNFTDEEYVPSVFDITTFTGVIIDAPGAPRWAGATVKYNF